MDPVETVVAGAGADAPAGGVSGPATPAGDDNFSPPPAGSPDPAAGAAAGEADAQPRPPVRDNAIPYSRVRQMLTQAEQRAEQRATERLRQELAPFLAELNPENMRRRLAQEMLTGLGVEPKKPEPKTVTEEQLAAIVRQQEDRFTQQLAGITEQQRIDNETRQAKAELDRIRGANEDLFEAFPQLEQIIANDWGSPWAVQNGVTFQQIADFHVAKLREGVSKFSQGLNAGADARAAVTPVRPGSARTPQGPKPPDVSTDDGARAAALSLLTRGRR